MKQLNYMLYKKANRALLFFLSLCSLFACSKAEPVKEEVKDPTAATLVFPNNNSECTEGTDITDLESTIKFQWNKGAHTDSYNLQLKDLNTGLTTNATTTEANYSIKLKRGNPYSWSIISKSNKTTTTASSSTWKFFNAGKGVSSYAPFPAEAVSPTYNENVTNGNITLDWTGNDIDNDIVSYTVYFGDNKPPIEYKSDVTESTLADVTIVAGKKYYWSIATKDAQGNISNSDIFSFNGI